MYSSPFCFLHLVGLEDQLILHLRRIGHTLDSSDDMHARRCPINLIPQEQRYKDLDTFYCSAKPSS